ncbi:uncharacterized protein A4U43_C03F26400 [Asparagus officinalis]|uniref:Uncharacterized protein n=1 Tax=Asparagus officinalis TaxID=4686 RepID=A0A5P1FE30_ASPOF|nr:uncharacterized protein A4U43_C03F26400 [Asparagus officinalis]
MREDSSEVEAERKELEEAIKNARERERRTLLLAVRLCIGGWSEMLYNLPPNLQSPNLAGNAFGQGISYSIWLMVSLKYL